MYEPTFLLRSITYAHYTKKTHFVHIFFFIITKKLVDNTK